MMNAMADARFTFRDICGFIEDDIGQRSRNMADGRRNARLSGALPVDDVVA